MKSVFAFMLLFGLALSAVTLIVLKGGKSMSLPHKDTEASIGLPHSDIYLSGIFATATFALG